VRSQFFDAREGDLALSFEGWLLNTEQEVVPEYKRRIKLQKLLQNSGCER
jgi:hypothetical protein